MPIELFEKKVQQAYVIPCTGDGGSRTHAPLQTYRISSATSYDHLSTSPYFSIIKPKGSPVKKKTIFSFVTLRFVFSDTAPLHWQNQ